MLHKLAELSVLAMTPPEAVTLEEVLLTCELVRELLEAQDVYIIRAGDPYFIRLGDDGDPRQYEVKRRGYWLVWKELAENMHSPASMFTVRDRLVKDPSPLAPGMQASLPDWRRATIVDAAPSQQACSFSSSAVQPLLQRLEPHRRC